MAVLPRHFVEPAGQWVEQGQLEITIPTILIDALIFPLRNHSKSNAVITTPARGRSGATDSTQIPGYSIVELGLSRT